MSEPYLERSYREGRIGEWKTTTRDDEPGWCLWEAQCSLDSQHKETYFALSGNVRGPDPALLEQVYRVLSNLGAIREIVDNEIRKSTPRGSVADFFLSRIADWDRHDDILQIEFAPIEQRILEEQKLLFWPGENPELDHRVLIRTIDVRIAPGQLVERGLI